MASMRDIKRRKTSIQSTQQITKAMKLVSTVKLQKAKSRAENTKPYFDMMYATVCSMLARTQNVMHPYLVENQSKKKAIIVITSNRGLAGGYNSNVAKLVLSSGIPVEDAEIYNVGRKGYEILDRKGYHIVKDDSEIMNEPLYKDAIDLTNQVLEAYKAGEIGEIHLAYTEFKNTVTHIPKMIKLLPISMESMQEQMESEDRDVPMNYEPDADEALDEIVPKYMTSLIFGAFVEALASENGARMQAMDSATSNAEEMISDLSLMYNRARQGSITQELTEIIAGASAIN